MANSDPHLEHLKRCLKQEVMVSSAPFSWFKTIHKAIKCPGRRYYFWWRIANYLYLSKRHRKLAIRLVRKLRIKYACDIHPGTQIGAGLRISHFVGIVISHRCIIGENFHIKQNVTIGVRHTSQSGHIHIGDRVEVGANSCIIGDDIYIGDNVIVGAMSFVNKNVPDNSVVLNKKEMTILPANV